MTDVPNGPDWWQASDGRRYPPHLHPEPRQPAPADDPFARPPQPQPHIWPAPLPDVRRSAETTRWWRRRWALAIGVVLAIAVVGSALAIGSDDRNDDGDSIVVDAAATELSTPPPSTPPDTAPSATDSAWSAPEADAPIVSTTVGTTTTTTTSPTTTTSTTSTTTIPPTTTTSTTATTTTVPPPPPSIAPAVDLPTSECHPNYSGCVPVASDVDCAGGSGDGPEYTGKVQVLGPDVYDLDRDGDGWACE